MKKIRTLDDIEGDKKKREQEELNRKINEIFGGIRKTFERKPKEKKKPSFWKILGWILLGVVLLDLILGSFLLLKIIIRNLFGI